MEGDGGSTPLPLHTQEEEAGLCTCSVEQEHVGMLAVFSLLPGPAEVLQQQEPGLHHRATDTPAHQLPRTSVRTRLLRT